jgi:hypothetical protein
MSFDAKQCAADAKVALSGIWSANDTKLIGVLCNKTRAQISQISAAYGADFMQDIKSKTSSDFESVMVALVTPLIGYDVRELYRAFAGLGTDEARVSEILGTRSQPEIALIKAAYAAEHKQNLRDRLISETSGDLKACYLNLVDGKQVDTSPELVAQHVAHLQKIENKEPRQSESDSLWITNCISGHSRAHALALVDQTLKLTGKTLDEIISAHTSGDVRVCLKILIQSPVKFLAAKLIKAFKARGVDDNTLIRILLGQLERAEPGLPALGAEVLAQSEKTLDVWVTDKCHGSEKTALRMILANFGQ